MIFHLHVITYLTPILSRIRRTQGQITCIDPIASSAYAGTQTKYSTKDYSSSAYDNPGYGGDYGAAWYVRHLATAV